MLRITALAALALLSGCATDGVVVTGNDFTMAASGQEEDYMSCG